MWGSNKGAAATTHVQPNVFAGTHCDMYDSGGAICFLKTARWQDSTTERSTLNMQRQKVPLQQQTRWCLLDV
jgi:hypothetical protein